MLSSIKRNLEIKPNLKRTHYIRILTCNPAKRQTHSPFWGSVRPISKQKLQVPAESVPTEHKASAILLPHPTRIFAAHSLAVMLGDYVRPPHVTRCQKYTYRISNKDYTTEALCIVLSRKRKILLISLLNAVPRGEEKSCIYQIQMHWNPQLGEGIVRQGKFASSMGIQAAQKADIRKLPGCIWQREVGLNNLTWIYYFEKVNIWALDL